MNVANIFNSINNVAKTVHYVKIWVYRYVSSSLQHDLRVKALEFQARMIPQLAVADNIRMLRIRLNGYNATDCFIQSQKQLLPWETNERNAGYAASAVACGSNSRFLILCVLSLIFP